jgi:putative Mg2+ transporter-C (MgtC) family protein
MPEVLDWTDYALRLALAVIAGGLMGIDRTTRGRPAGMRTTMLVCLAAALAIVLGEALTAGSDPSRTRFDPLRLAQGILAGMGFIGAGAIVRRDDMVLGVTTAATLWLSTVLGLCIGAGQWRLAVAALACGLLILWCLHILEDRIHHERRATLRITLPIDGPRDERLRSQVEASGCAIWSWAIDVDRSENSRRITCSVSWRDRARENRPPAFVEDLAADPSVLSMSWRPMAQ